MSEYVAPIFKGDAFHCPHCNVLSHMIWGALSSTRHDGQSRWTNFLCSTCSHCEQEMFWLVTDGGSPLIPLLAAAKSGVMVYPDTMIAPTPSDDMPDDIKKDYLEAANICQKSPRGAAALLRLATEKMFTELEKGHNAVEDSKKKTHLATIIQSFKDKNIINETLFMVADSLRLAGNGAVHPGKIDSDNISEITTELFEFINLIVDKLITEPKKAKEIFDKIKAKKNK
ncbi:DUF4145 domain-containing protein [Morganella morganii]|uniref:DUF4145 domain-containing protein n=1 Tax=Morganella morganii TaxID=582 RepID=UPI0009237751|nr:DUF4145 domain-containing protein [Morganella morganii]SGE29111.1 Uncharacterised protein [Mycobacterium tuberculosis]EKL3976803.1 DUF4145 domain-containing protein [Morganella morganii]ELB1013073.1 DUF4145 domain-containing protein [Morganella morganii]MBA5838309.1 DUF4145 domain-containing protein [Morganella morganii]MBT0415679.1 DUF4145 domain-containing protein [Morganella morganii subsp. morganii]